MRTIGNSIGSLAIIGGLIASLNFVHAQTTAKAVQSVSAEDMAVMLQAVEATTPVSAEAIPPVGTFYSAQNPNWPPLPGNINQVPVWNLGDGIYLMDDRSVDYSALQAQANEQGQLETMAGNRAMATSMTAMSVPLPVGGGSGTNSMMANAFVNAVDYGTNLWIANFPLSSGYASGAISNTTADIQYELQYKTDLMQSNWQSANWFVFGSEVTNWTAWSLPLNGMSNLYLLVRSWEDDGSGLPIWWQLQYFGTTGIDPYGNPAGDGWNNLQKFQNGMNPNLFYTPPAPQLAVSYNVFSRLATLSWTPMLTPATSYVVKRCDFEFGDYFLSTNFFNLSGNTNSFQDNSPALAPIYSDDPSREGLHTYYQIQAHYPVGDSAWSDPVYVQPDAIASISLIPGPQNSACLAVASLPSGTTTLRVTRIDLMARVWNDYSFNATNDIPVSAATNGLYMLPASIAASPENAHGYATYCWYVEPLNGSGQGVGSLLVINGFYSQETDDLQNWIVPPYFDGRTQLKQNLIFKLRAATMDSPFQFSESVNGVLYPFFTNQSGYVSASFYQEPIYYNNGGNITFDPLWPFEENTLFRNFVFSLPDAGPSTNGYYTPLGHLTTGVNGNYDDYYNNPSSYPTALILTAPAKYQFTLNTTNGGTIPPLLATNQTRWLCSYPLDSPEMYWNGEEMASYGYLEEIGVTPSYDGDWNQWETMAANVRNYWGLPFLSAAISYGNIAGTAAEATILSAGNQVENVDGYFYAETAQPQFQLVEYDFWSPPYWPSYNTNLMAAFPGMPGFSTTNTSQIMIVNVGQAQFRVAGYAKLAIQNGYSGVYGYLGQYFDQAYQIDTNGVVTTNTTGILSPYGDFFPTQPGPAALVTMPDLDTGARGTCMVYCVSLALDANHDGTMDTSFGGPDNTSASSPFQFWANNDNDGTGVGKDIQVFPGTTPLDYQFGNIRSKRNLEDFFRLWICGLPKLPTTNGYAITLSMSTVSGSPAINLYRSFDTNGSASYLSDTNAAAAQFTQMYLGDQLIIDYAKRLGTVSPSQTYTVPVSTDGTPDYTHFLFEGAGIGEGQLTMTISQNGNTLAQSSVWLDLRDLKDFYEQAAITNNISGTISNWTSGVEMVQPAIASALGDDTNLIVLVHGINVGDADWRIESDTVFKRLYWAGFHGKFATVKWPCNFFDWSLLSTRTSVFNQSEAKAYKAGAALKTYIDQLHARFPGYRLHLLVHSQGNAIVGEAIEQGAVFDTYILTQGAMPASAYDVAAPTDAGLLQQEAITPTPEWQPMGYHGVYTNITGRIVNFYNTNDPVLKIWMDDQGPGKPDGYLDHLLHSEGLPVSYYEYDGVDSWYYAALIIGSHLVTDPQESRAMVSRSRTLPIGQSGPETQHGVINSGVDLYVRYGFFKAFPGDHSAQWTWPIQTTRPYFQQVLTKCQLTPAP